MKNLNTTLLEKSSFCRYKIRSTYDMTYVCSFELELILTRVGHSQLPGGSQIKEIVFLRGKNPVPVKRPIKLVQNCVLEMQGSKIV